MKQLANGFYGISHDLCKRSDASFYIVSVPYDAKRAPKKERLYVTSNPAAAVEPADGIHNRKRRCGLMVFIGNGQY